ncbi:MAG: T9SS type A sorting domain-containing protein [Crocinitomicaceae bacterium]|nr:T9SS type A sorting domain-containing protein [Crocinitomicaceae bacterium]
MKKQILTSLMGLGIILNAGSQISEGGIPASFRKTLVDETSIFDQSYHVHTLVSPDMDAVRQEDAENDMKGKPYRVGINIPVSYNMYNSGTWLTLENGDKIWRLGIRIPDATGLSLYFSEPVQIPAGGKLHAYNAKHSQYVGAYTSNTPTFKAMEIIQGDFITLEYYMPAGSFDLPVIEISEIAYYYRGFEARLASFNEADEITQERAHGSCEVDAVCSESTGHVDQRSSAVHYSFVAGGTFVCSGAVINNTDNDCTPYILTANHCGEPNATSDIDDHVWYFNYQRPSCSPGNTSSYPGALSQTMSGGIFRASSSLGTHPAGSGSQLDGSDFALIELSSSIPAGYNPYFSGWSRSTTGATSGVCYHHPAGDEKKISTYSSSLSSATYNGGWANAHWEVQWVATANGHGVTEGGSSGSPIYDQNNRIVGHLSGGSSYCSTPDQTDLYGKFNQAWSNDGSGNSSRLQPWLDPGSTGAMTLNGTFAPCAPVAPVADFVASATNVTPSTTVTFTDLSTGSPTSWAWVVAPASGWAYAGGTNSTSQNPQITFTTAGLYTITLTATNTQGSDAETKNNYIVVAASTGPCNSTSTQSCTSTDEFISIVEFNTINNNTACGNYTNYSGVSTTVTKGNSYDLTITPAVGTTDGTAYTNDEIAAWIDWNDDNDFNDANEDVAYVLVASGWNNVFSVTVPLTAVTGSVVMRVKLSYNPDDGDIDPCAATQWGETEDYVVNIQASGSSELTENNLGAVEMYPNPTNGNLTVDLSDVESEVVSVELRDVTGRIISSTTIINNKVNFNLNGESSGIYFVKVNGTNGSITRKIVKL